MVSLLGLTRDKVDIIIQPTKMKTQFIVFLLFGAVTVSCNRDYALESFTLNEIKSLGNYSELTSVDYLRLCSSVQVLDSIFKNQDNSVELFKSEFRAGFKKPVLLLQGDKDFKNWISSTQLALLEKLRNSKQKCYPLTNSYSSVPANYMSTIGEEALFLLHLYEGRRQMNSKSN